MRTSVNYCFRTDQADHFAARVRRLKFLLKATGAEQVIERALDQLEDHLDIPRLEHGDFRL